MDILQKIERRSQELGFIAWGICKAHFLAEEKEHFEQWIQKGYHGTMSYLERNTDKRLDPSLLVEGTQSILSVAYNYFPRSSAQEGLPKIAKYAYGEDYHRVLKDRCHELMETIKEDFPQVRYRIFVDSAPVMERQWAQKAGIGWIGKNSLLLRKGVGSFFFLGEIFLDIALPETKADSTDHCGTCTRCIDACPTQAIVSDQVIDANKCISYLSIEKKDRLSVTELSSMQGWIFGCDICQDVCPWNRFSSPHEEPRFEPFDFVHWERETWNHLDAESFENTFSKSPVSRMGFAKLKQLLSK